MQGVIAISDVGPVGPEGPAGVVPDLATQAEAEAGTNNEVLMTPLRAAQAITVQAAKTQFFNTTITSTGWVLQTSGT